VAWPIFKRIRKFFESIAYAGLQPGTRPQPKRATWLGPLSGPLDRLLSGGPAPSDPLYLTNRSTAQKVKIAALIGIPCLALGFLMYAMLTGIFRFGSPPPPHEASPGEIAAKLLPHMDPDMHIDTDKDVEVVEVRVEHGAQISIVGSMKNNTNHEIRVAEAIFNLTDSGGSGLGGVSARVENFKARSTAKFKVPIQQNAAAFALVREIHTQ
jgi:hypothetical protein